MSPKALVGIILLAIAAFIGVNSAYVISQKEKAILLKLGKITNPDVQPGLHFKIPFIEEVRRFEGRILTSRTEAQRFLTLEKKGMIVTYFAKWKIADVAKFYTATNGDLNAANSAIARPVNEGLRNEFGQRTLQEVVSGERDELMTDLIDKVSEFSRDTLGVEIIDVRVKQIDLPSDVSSSVYNRMTAEREQEARQLRSQGKEYAEGTRADADRQEVVIEAEAYREAQRIMGEGDATAAAVYAQAYNKDPEFYAFMHSLDAYKQAFQSPSDLLLVDPDSDFFRYLNNKKAK